MLERYSSKEMRAIWSEENKYAAWLEVEIASVEAWAKLGKIPCTEAKALRQHARLNIRRMKEIEQETKHDVVAFTRMLSESLGPEKKWVHYGLTSTDVVDTANGYLLKQANQQIWQHLQCLEATVLRLARRYQHTWCIGRTHGVHAEPTSFGLKLLAFYAELKRGERRFQAAATEVECGKISGAVGTFANVPPFIEAEVCAQLGLQVAEISTQVLPRDLHAAYIESIALLATSVERFATELRHLQRTEVREVMENFQVGQAGSSAMPHKKNPISSENITGLARLLRSYIYPALEDIVLWHERDISHSSVERMMLPDATSLFAYMLQRMTQLLDTLYVDEAKMAQNIQQTKGLICSQQVLLALVEAGLSREEAYHLVQPLALQAWQEEATFKNLVLTSKVMTYLTVEQVEVLFSLTTHFKEIDMIYERVLKKWGIEE